MKTGLLYVRKADFSFVNPVVATKLTKKLPLVFKTYVTTTPVRVMVDQAFGCVHSVVAPLMSNVIILLVKLDLVGIKIISYNNNCNTVSGKAFKDVQGVKITTAILLDILFFGHYGGGCLHVDSVMLKLYVNCTLTCFLNVISVTTTSSRDLVKFGVPVPFGCKLSLGFSTFITVNLICLVATVRTANSIATGSVVSKGSVRKRSCLGHISNNILTSKIGSFVTKVFGSFPGSVFTRGGNVVRLAKITDQCIKCCVTNVLILLKLFPIINIIFSLVPSPILNKTALLVFNAITTTNVQVVTSRRVGQGTALILTIDLSLNLKIRLVPSVLGATPRTMGNVFSSKVAANKLTTVVTGMLVQIGRSGARWG